MSAEESRRSNRLAAAAATLNATEIPPDIEMQSLKSGSSSEVVVMGKKRVTRKRKNDEIDDEPDISDGQSDNDSYSDSSDEDAPKSSTKGKRTGAKAQRGAPKAKRQKGSKGTKNKSPKKSAGSSSNKKYGPESERTCPYCKKVFSILLGLAYHLERRVCQKEIIDVDAEGDASQSAPKIHGKLMPGEKFVTSYGVVQVVSDDRVAASSSNQTTAPPVQEKRKDTITRRKNRIFMTAAKYQRRRRQKFLQLFHENVTGEKLQAEVWKEYCTSTTPAAILSGSWSWKTHKESAKATPVMENTQAAPPDTSGDRIVECVLIKDERRKVTDIENDMQDEGRLTKVDVAKAAVEKAKKEALLMMNNLNSNTTTTCIMISPSAVHESGMKIYIQRRLLDERYNDKIPIYECFRCGRVFSSRIGLKGHLQESVCEKKADQFVKDRLERLEMIEKGLDEADVKEPQRDKSQPGATVVVGSRKIKASVFKKLPGWIVFHANRSSIYPEVFEGLEFKRGSNNSKFLQKKWEAMGPGRKRVRNRKRKGRQTSGEGETAERQSRRRSSNSKASGDNGPDSDSEYDSEYSATSDEYSYDPGANSLDIGSENGSAIQMPPLPTPPTYQIPNAYEIPVQFLAITEGSNQSAVASPSNLVLKNTAEQKAPLKTSATPAVAKQKAPTKPTNASGIVERPKAPAKSSGIVEKPKAPTNTSKVVKTPKVSTNIASVAEKPIVPTNTISSSIVVDPSVFVEEIHAGRYPSIKVYTGDHMTCCLICKDEGGQLLTCEFCSNAEHISCLKTRVNIRDFEPDDEFMCHKCIQTILSRRARAQKRRLQKRDERLGTQNEDNPIPLPVELSQLILDTSLETPSESASLNLTTDLALISAAASDLPSIDHIEAPRTFQCPNGGPGGLICCDLCTASYSKMLSETEKEQEIHMVSKIGQEVSELMELLTDAQIRLQQALDASKGNDKRRKLLSSSNMSNSLQETGNM